jgi:hypothetical protein
MVQLVLAFKKKCGLTTWKLKFSCHLGDEGLICRCLYLVELIGVVVVVVRTLVPQYMSG